MARKTLLFYTVWGWASSAEGEAGQVCWPCFELSRGSEGILCQERDEAGVASLERLSGRAGTLGIS